MHRTFTNNVVRPVIEFSRLLWEDAEGELDPKQEHEVRVSEYS